MNFTREPIIETIISPKEGHKIVVRSSKVVGQEEYFVDAVQVVSFGNSLFFRSLERPKPFLVPVTDYEVLEVRETRMVLKNAVVMDRSIKIGGGKEVKNSEKKIDTAKPDDEVTEEVLDKKPSKRRSVRRRRGRNDPSTNKEEARAIESAKIEVEESKFNKEEETAVSSSVLSLLFPPPTTLISQKISKNKNTVLNEKGIVENSESAIESTGMDLSEDNAELVQASSLVFSEPGASDSEQEEKSEDVTN